MRLLIVLMVVCAASAVDWAVIVAGSNTYGNYRHQADACHAYQVVHEGGIADENIIMMYYDDIANSAQNPFKGKIFNKPTAAGTPGKDVYAGCKKDYTGRHVTPENFIAVLSGDNSTTGGLPVLQSGPNDNVFVNFVDHGGPGIIAFPAGQLSATKLNQAIKTAHSKNMFSKLVFYLEACESGSMFEGIIDPSMNVYVTTASNADESSWGTYCPPDDKINGKEMNTCLGDLYSVNWMQNAESAGGKETLEAQFEAVKKLTDKSHVMQYGDLDYTSDPISEFLGGSLAKTGVRSEPPNPAGIVPSRDIPLHLAYYKYLRTEQFDIKARRAAGEALRQQIESRLRADEIFHTLSTTFGSTALMSTPPATPVICGKCCDEVNAVYKSHCGGYDDYSMQYMRTVHNICKSGAKADVVATKLMGICKKIAAA